MGDDIAVIGMNGRFPELPALLNFLKILSRVRKVSPFLPMRSCEKPV